MRFKKGETPKGAKPFKKGQSGNIKGRPPKLLSAINAELKVKGYERVTPSQISEAYELLFNLPQDEMTAQALDKKNPMILRIVAKEMMGKNGVAMLKEMVDRAQGRSKQSIENSITLENNMPNLTFMIQSNDPKPKAGSRSK